jgi:hypothetical protein
MSFFFSLKDARKLGHARAMPRSPALQQYAFASGGALDFDQIASPVHNDHSGNLPLLVERKFIGSGLTSASEPTSF